MCLGIRIRNATFQIFFVFKEKSKNQVIILLKTVSDDKLHLLRP